MVKCNTIGCNKTAKFGFFVDKIKITCAEHRILTPIKMIDLTRKLCKCGFQANFGFISDNIKICCSKCKDNDMVDLLNKKCKCGTNASYGLTSDNIRICCAKCKTEDMIDLINKNKLCFCGSRPNYGLFDDTVASCCAKCKTDDMIDITHYKCVCGIQPIYGFTSDKVPTCCIKCKKEDMIDLKHFKCSCGTRPNFGLSNDKVPTCCVKCKTEEMVNIVDARCKATDNNGEKYCNTRGNPKYDNYCTHCFANLFPLDPRTPNIRKKTKEIAVRNFINANFDGFCHDEPLWLDGCDCTHRRRIDHRKLINGTLLSTGTDEYQHKGYDKYDEMIRYDDLYMIHSGKFIYIRFNPDPYRENGILKDPPMEERLEALKKEIEKQIKRIENDENDELMEIIYMYYDC